MSSPSESKRDPSSAPGYSVSVSISSSSSNTPISPGPKPFPLRPSPKRKADVAKELLDAADKWHAAEKKGTDGDESFAARTKELLAMFFPPPEKPASPHCVRQEPPAFIRGPCLKRRVTELMDVAKRAGGGEGHNNGKEGKEETLPTSNPKLEQKNKESEINARIKHISGFLDALGLLRLDGSRTILDENRWHLIPSRLKEGRNTKRLPQNYNEYYRLDLVFDRGSKYFFQRLMMALTYEMKRTPESDTLSKSFFEIETTRSIRGDEILVKFNARLNEESQTVEIRIDAEEENTAKMAAAEVNRALQNLPGRFNLGIDPDNIVLFPASNAPRNDGVMLSQIRGIIDKQSDKKFIKSVEGRKVRVEHYLFWGNCEKKTVTLEGKYHLGYLAACIMKDKLYLPLHRDWEVIKKVVGDKKVRMIVMRK
eukprot:jgi/Bigna1/84418/fgenesh1_pg.135_\